MPDRRYHLAQICENGHTITAALNRYPGKGETYCSKCGAKTIIQCPHCAADIRGYSGYGDFYTRPSYCPECSNPYPWTEAAVKAARELGQIELDQADLNDLANIIESLVRDTPQTTVAAARFRKLMDKATPAAVEGFKAILINVVTEAAKKMIFPAP